MRILYSFVVICLSFTLTCCTTTPTQQKYKNPHKNQHKNHPITHTPISSAATHQQKNPLKVTFYTKGQPKEPYTVLGEESISKFNLGGSKRQEANIRDGMRELAAAMGGDAVINIKNNGSAISGTVVAYQKEKTESKG